MKSVVRIVVQGDVQALVLTVVRPHVKEHVKVRVKGVVLINVQDAGVDVVVHARTLVRTNVIEDNP